MLNYLLTVLLLLFFACLCVWRVCVCVWGGYFVWFVFT